MQSPLRALLPIALVVMLSGAASRGMQAEADRLATIKQFQSLTHAQQEQWLHRLFSERTERAAVLVLSDDEYDRLRAFHEKILKRVAASERISDQGLAKLLDEAERHERAAIERLARRYRVEVYRGFRTNRLEYERRILALKRVYSSWESAGAIGSQQWQLITWLEAAIDRMQLGRYDRLPSIPRFGAVANNKQPAAKPALTASALQASPALQPTAQAIRQAQTSGPGVGRLPGDLVAAQAELELPTPAVISRPRSAGEVPAGTTISGQRLAKRPTYAPTTAKATVAPTIEPVRGQPVGDAIAATSVIDLSELTVRVTGYNVALAGLVGRLQETEAWSTAKLSEATEELTELLTRRADLLLYRNLLSDSDLAGIGSLASPDAAISLLGAKIYSARMKIQDSATGNDSGELALDLEQLDLLSRRLAELATEEQQERRFRVR